MNGTNHDKVKRLVGVGLFTAMVIILQFLGSFIHFGVFSVSLVLLPIVLGAAMYGVWAGAWLGFVFGWVVIASGDAGAFLAVNPAGTVVTVLAKGLLAGIITGVVYKLTEHVNKYFAVILAAIVCPVVNTGVFLLGCLAFFMDTIGQWAQNMGFGDNVAKYMFLGLAGGNFIFELGINVILSPVILRLIKVGKKET